MSVSFKLNQSFDEIKKSSFQEGLTPYSAWKDAQPATTSNTSKEVDVLEHFRFNIEQLEDLNARFQFVLQELSSVLIKK